MKREKQLSVNEWLEVFKYYKEYLSQNITRIAISRNNAISFY
ncbi:hypothetical protein [Mycoplasma sp. HU2014]|nr:hypothetical protein [Mycoplasma sp. HU2014]